MQVASEEGMRVTDHLSLLTDFTTGGLYDDYTVYVLDQQIFGRRARVRKSAAAALAAGVVVDHGVSLSLRQQLSRC